MRRPARRRWWTAPAATVPAPLVQGDVGARDQRVTDPAGGLLPAPASNAVQTSASASPARPTLRYICAKLSPTIDRHLPGTDAGEVLARALVVLDGLVRLLQRGMVHALVVLGLGQAPDVAGGAIGRLCLLAQRHRAVRLAAHGVGVAQVVAGPGDDLRIALVLHLRRRAQRLADAIAVAARDLLARTQEAGGGGGQRVIAHAGEAVQAQHGLGQRSVVVGVDRGHTQLPEQVALLFRGGAAGALVELLAQLGDQAVRIGHGAVAHGIARRQRGRGMRERRQQTQAKQQQTAHRGPPSGTNAPIVAHAATPANASPGHAARQANGPGRRSGRNRNDRRHPESPPRTHVTAADRGGKPAQPNRPAGGSPDAARGPWPPADAGSPAHPHGGTGTSFSCAWKLHFFQDVIFDLRSARMPVTQEIASRRHV
ncbi:hypothetical protein RLIN73S_04736 [Rhodanobacter lindaniclasticus]